MQNNQEFNLNDNNLITTNLNANQCMNLRNNPVNNFRENGYNAFSNYHTGDLISYNNSLFMSPVGDCVTGTAGYNLFTPGSTNSLWIGNFPSIKSSITSVTFTNDGFIKIPANINTVYVTGCGGGGGASFTKGTNDGGGGAAGGVINLPLSGVASQTIVITIGRGGSITFGGAGYNQGTNSIPSGIAFGGGGGGSTGVAYGPFILILGGGGGGGSISTDSSQQAPGGFGGGPIGSGNGGNPGNGGSGGGVGILYNGGITSTVFSANNSLGKIYNGANGGNYNLNGNSLPFLTDGGIASTKIVNNQTNYSGGGGAGLFSNGGDLNNIAGFGAGGGPANNIDNKGGDGKVTIWYFNS